jgi:hypothetical protein
VSAERGRDREGGRERGQEERRREREVSGEGPGDNSSCDDGAGLLVDDVVDATAGVQVFGVVDDLESVETHLRVGTVCAARVRRKLEARGQSGLEISLRGESGGGSRERG